MAQYISKSAVKAELEKRIEETKGMQPKFDQFWAGNISAFKGVLKIIDTLEVKEVEEEPSDDLEEEIDKELHENWYGEYINLDKFRESANHFYELGLKAKGE